MLWMRRHVLLVHSLNGFLLERKVKAGKVRLD